MIAPHTDLRQAQYNIISPNASIHKITWMRKNEANYLP